MIGRAVTKLRIFDACKLAKVTKPWKILTFNFLTETSLRSTGSAGLIDLLCHLGIGRVDGSSFLQLDQRGGILSLLTQTSGSSD